MYFERSAPGGDPVSQERRNQAQSRSRVLGRIIRCDGARATILAVTEGLHARGADWTVGRMVSVNLGVTRTVGLTYGVEATGADWEEGGVNRIIVHVELVGEVRDIDGNPVFDRGITVYPHIGAEAHRIRSGDLEAVYDLGGRNAVSIGALSQDAAIDARIAIDATLDRHFAVLGTTGVGKSSAVALLLRKAIDARPDLRVLILDPHNEFHAAFAERSVRIDTATLDLPFWLFRLEEFAEVIFRGRAPVPEEMDLLRDLIPQARARYRQPAGAASLRRGSDTGAYTADMPVPYRINDLLQLLDEKMGQLEAKHERPHCRSLRTRVESALADPRYRFMFASRLIEDSIHETIGKVFRIPHHDRPVTCIELAGLPPEVVNSVCSVLSRMAFDLASGSDGALQLLVLCEEAHRYMPADPRLGFAPTRHALSRIAKEGRKYGCYLGVVTQRPGDLDPTVLSQCSTIFAMRLANERDQEIIRSAIADSSASSLTFLSSMGQREAIAFGEGVATTMRLKFEQLQPRFLPSSGRGEDRLTQGRPAIDLDALVNGLRGVSGTDPLEEAPRTVSPPAQRPVQTETAGIRRRDYDDRLRRLYED